MGVASPEAERAGRFSGYRKIAGEPEAKKHKQNWKQFRRGCSTGKTYKFYALNCLRLSCLDVSPASEVSCLDVSPAS